MPIEPGLPVAAPSRDPDAEVVAHLKGLSRPCPRCGYDLRDVPTAACPECGEHLELTIGMAQARFGWLIVAMAPGCFSGIMALFVMIPVVLTIGRTFPPGQGLPWPIVMADLFGFTSAASVVVMYRLRQRIMRLPTRRQVFFALGVWGVHVFMLILVMTTMTLLF